MYVYVPGWSRQRHIYKEMVRNGTNAPKSGVMVKSLEHMIILDVLGKLSDRGSGRAIVLTSMFFIGILELILLSKKKLETKYI